MTAKGSGQTHISVGYVCCCWNGLIAVGGRTVCEEKEKRKEKRAEGKVYEARGSALAALQDDDATYLLQLEWTRTRRRPCHFRQRSYCKYL